MATVISGTTGVTFPAGGLGNPAGTVVGTTDTQTLTNKTIQGGSLTLATSITASGTAVDFTDIPSWVKRVTMTLAGVSTNGTSIWLVQLGTSSGVVSSGYSGAASIVSASSVVSSAYTDGMAIRSGNASNVVSGLVTVVKSSGNVWSLAHTAASTLSASFLGGSSVDLGDTLTQLRITTVSGTQTFDAGTINIMYEG